VWAEKDGEWYLTLVRDGWVNRRNYVDEFNMAMMVKNINADPKVILNDLPND